MADVLSIFLSQTRESIKFSRPHLHRRRIIYIMCDRITIIKFAVRTNSPLIRILVNKDLHSWLQTTFIVGN